MIKKNKGFFIVTCVITILPMIFGILLWNKLPDQVATHFGFDGKADGYSSKFFAVVGVYLFCLAMHVLCAKYQFKDLPSGIMYLSSGIRMGRCTYIWECIGIYEFNEHGCFDQCIAGCDIHSGWKLPSKMQTELYGRNQTAMDAGR